MALNHALEVYFKRKAQRAKMGSFLKNLRTLHKPEKPSFQGLAES